MANFYPTLTIQPDFNMSQTSGIESGARTVNIAKAERYVNWSGMGRRFFNYQYNAMTSEEVRALREFFNNAQGQKGGFYLPSWSRDFSGVGLATAGDDFITIADSN